MVDGPDPWFFLDEFDFLAHRTAWDLDDLLRPHNEHWSTVPILIFRAMYRLVGMHSYVPYRALSVGTHLLAAVLMRLLLRRIGVGPWLATAVVVPWILFGSGWHDILWGFQVAWNSVLVCGTGQLLLADHPGPLGRRDAAALVLGLVGLMCAGIAVPLVGAVGLCLLLRRGWRSAALQVVPLAVVYGLWSVAYGDSGVLNDPGPSWKKMEFVWSGISGAVSAFAWFDGWDLVLTLAVVVVLVAGARAGRLGSVRGRLAIPIGMALGAALYLYVVGSGRLAFGPSFARSSRYLHVVAYLLLPILGLAVAQVAEASRGLAPRWRAAATIGVLAVIWMGVPGNAARLSDEVAEVSSSGIVRAVAAAAVDRQTLPEAGAPLPFAAPEATIGWFRQAVAEGRLDPLRTADPDLARQVIESLQVVQIDEAPSGMHCRPLERQETVELAAGERVGFEGAAVNGLVTSAEVTDLPTGYYLTYGRTFEAVVDLTWVLAPDGGGGASAICR